MKATLEFNLPEEQSEFNHVTKGEDYYYCLERIREYLRRELKYNNELNEIERQTIEKVKEEFNEILTDCNIIL